MMASKTVNIDFEAMYKSVVHYFKTLTQDMVIAWSVLGVGLLVLIISFFL
jgi:hypothetical protein